jgi:hypothetical protein
MSPRNWGVRELLDGVHSLAGPRGNLWAVGSQNVGKSTLISAMAQWRPALCDGSADGVASARDHSGGNKGRWGARGES